MKKKFVCLIVVVTCLFMGIMSAYAGTQYTKYACGHKVTTGSTGKGPDKTVTSSEKCPDCVLKTKPVRRGDNNSRQIQYGSTTTTVPSKSGK